MKGLLLNNWILLILIWAAGCVVAIRNTGSGEVNYGMNKENVKEPETNFLPITVTQNIDTIKKNQKKFEQILREEKKVWTDSFRVEYRRDSIRTLQRIDSILRRP